MAPDGTIGGILPYRLMNPKLLPIKVANKLKIEWRPVLAHMQSAIDLSNLKQEDISSEYINSTFATAKEHLKLNVCSYVWHRYKKNESWKISTWSKRVSYKVIKSEGTKNDIINLPAATKIKYEKK